MTGHADYLRSPNHVSIRVRRHHYHACWRPISDGNGSSWAKTLGRAMTENGRQRTCHATARGMPAAPATEVQPGTDFR